LTMCAGLCVACALWPHSRIIQATGSDFIQEDSMFGSQNDNSVFGSLPELNSLAELPEGTLPAIGMQLQVDTLTKVSTSTASHTARPI
jgi:hypothetical protein